MTYARRRVAGVLAILIVVGTAYLGATIVLTPEPPLVLHEAAASPTAIAAPSPLAAASPSSVAARARRVRIVGAGLEEVNLRAEPSARGTRVKGLADGAELELLGHEVESSGRDWRDVRDPTDGSEGWVAAEFLGPGG